MVIHPPTQSIRTHTPKIRKNHTTTHPNSLKRLKTTHESVGEKEKIDKNHTTTCGQTRGKEEKGVVVD